jgi:hypothetical protein
LLNNQRRHARPCVGHPGLVSLMQRTTWMAGTQASEATRSFGRRCPAMTMRVGHCEAWQQVRFLLLF